MNRTSVILNLLVASIAIGSPIEEKSAASAIKTTDEYTAIARTSDEADNDSFISVNNDDLLRTSDLVKVYNSVENKIATTRTLKEQSENEKYDKAELKEESRTAKVSKSPDNVAATPEGRATIPEKEGESKAASKEESKSAEVTSKLESSATTDRSESKSSDYLENDKGDENISEKTAPDGESKRRSFDIINDESNSAWDVLDDIPARRMFSRPNNLMVVSKAISDDKQVVPSEVRIAPKPNLKPSNQAFGSIRPPALRIPHSHPVLPLRRFSIPPSITIGTAVPIDFGSILSQESIKLINQNRNNELDERSVISSDLDANAYPYTPLEETPTMSQIPAKSIFAKLAQASEHPQKISPNFGGDNSNIILGLPYYNAKQTYFIPTNYGAYKYVTG